MAYGKELILDLHGCDSMTFTRKSIGELFIQVCSVANMQREDLHFWDDLDTPEAEKETEAHLVGTSAVQFIRTSNITIHALDLMRAVYFNFFSCKDYDEEEIIRLVSKWFDGTVVRANVIERA